MAILMLLNLLCCATPPGFTVTNVPTLGSLISGKDCFGAAASLTSMDFAHEADTGQRENSTHTQRSFSNTSILIEQFINI